MKNKTIISIRSNCDFSLNYETSNLHPQVELILIASSPKYSLDKKATKIIKEQDVEEFRFKCDLQGVNRLIGELQLIVKNMNQFEQLSASFNSLIEQSKDKKDVG